MNGTQNSRDRETLPSIGNEETKVSQILESDLERDTLVDEITPDMTAPGRLERRRFRTISVEEYLKHISEDSEYNLRLSKVGL